MTWTQTSFQKLDYPFSTLKDVIINLGCTTATTTAAATTTTATTTTATTAAAAAATTTATTTTTLALRLTLYL